MTDVVDYVSLQTAIQEWMLGRTDLASYTTMFIKNAEARFNYGVDEESPFPSLPIRVRQMVDSEDITLTSGSGSLPSDFLEAIRVTALTSPRTFLEYAPSGWVDEIYPDTTASDPAFYTILGSSILVRPVTTSQVELQYYAKIAALSDSATTNWLITASPNVYLYASLVEACMFLGTTQAMARAQVFFGMMKGAIGGLVRTEKRAAYGTQPSRRASGAVA